MKKCLNLAKLGFKTESNPLVGCIITHENRIISTGYHKEFGGPHAEVNAIQKLKKKFPNKYKSLLKNSTLYVNLEPCAHYGKTPPCVNIIIKNNIKTVIIGVKDPFKEVNGRSIKKLKNHAKVIVGILKKECKEVNKKYFINQELKRPLIILKWAKSKDGFINNNKKGITKISCQKSIKLSHKWRSEIDSIMVGTNTVKFDNPRLTTRHAVGTNPIRITIDKNNTFSKKTYNILNPESETIVLNENLNKKIKNIQYLNYSKKIKKNSTDKQKLKAIISIIYKQNITSILIEGGRTILQNLIDMNLWDEARIFTSNKILKNGIKEPKIIIGNKKNNTEKCGEDLLTFIYNKSDF